MLYLMEAMAKIFYKDMTLFIYIYIYIDFFIWCHDMTLVSWIGTYHLQSALTTIYGHIHLLKLKLIVVYVTSPIDLIGTSNPQQN